MFVLLIVLLSGMGVGFLLRKRTRILKTFDPVLIVVIFVLLFFLGLAFGSNETVVKSLDRVVFHATFISVGALTGSITVSYLIFRWFFKVQEDSKNPFGR